MTRIAEAACQSRLSALNTAGVNATSASSMYVSVQKGRHVPSSVAEK